MPLINCPECGKPVSTSAHSCPNCGYPVAEKVAQQPELAAAAAGTTTSTPAPVAAGQPAPAPELLAEIRPSWWGFFWYWFFFFLIVPPIVAYFKRASTVLRIFSHRVTLERGIFNKCYQDFNPKDIRSIDVDQSFFQRMVNIGDLTLSTAATVEAAEQLKSIPDPRGVRDMIIAQRGTN